MTVHARMGFFQDFKESNTLCGDEEGLQRLADHLRPFEGPIAKPLNLHLLPFVQVQGGVSLTARPVDRELGVRQTGPFSFDWLHSQEGWLESAEKIAAVARGSGGHCYLGEAMAGDAVVMVSKGKYDEGW
jgi:hypothetical protein